MGREGGRLRLDWCLLCWTLINFSSKEEALVVLKTTEEGKLVVEKVGEMMSSCQDQNLLQLGCMFLANILRADRKF